MDFLQSPIQHNFVELRAKTHYSFLRGASSPQEMVEAAYTLGHRGLGICDLSGVYGIPKAYQAKQNLVPKNKTFKLIVGAEVPWIQHAPLFLIATKRDGYGLLCRLLTACHQDTPKGIGGIDTARLFHYLQEPAAQSLIAITEVTPQLFELSKLKALFEKRLYLALPRYLDGQDSERTLHTLALSRSHSITIVASNHPLTHTRKRQPIQDTVTAIREGRPLKDLGFLVAQNQERTLKSINELSQLYADLPNAIHTTLEIAEQCTFCPSELRYRYPSEWIPSNHTAQSYLESLCQKGLLNRYGQTPPETVIRQLHHELQLVQKLDFAHYFLTVYDIVDFARSQSILCQGRGSAANSVVCFVLGITAIDPVRMNLLFERFISAERGEPPDIDVDFEHERREEVIQYIYQKYGRHRAAMVSAVVTYRHRSAFRETAKALGVQVGTLSARKVRTNYDSLSGATPELKPIIESIADQLEGAPRHLSIHSGGFTLSADPITEIVPVEPATLEGRTIIQWDKYDLDILGLLKIDVLSLGILSALKKLELSTGIPITAIPAEDTATYDMICAADTVGTFQIESRAQMSMLPRLKPRTFYDLVVEVALVRPGPIVGKMVHPYIRRRNGLEKFDLSDPKLNEILGRTYGVPIFQEQVMKMAVAFAGFTPGEADELRRAIGAWRSSGSIEKVGERLMSGLIRYGFKHQFAQQIFEQIKGFSEYGFPESHAASFALLSYASCYYKHYFPAEFACAIINSQPMGFYSNHTLLDDAKRHGVQSLPIHPNRSHWDLTLEPDENPKKIRLGFRVIHGMSQRDFSNLEQARQDRPFQSFTDFLNRSGVRLAVCRTLALADAFLPFGISQRQALWDILAFETLVRAQSTSKGLAPAQLSLFEDRLPVQSLSFKPLSPLKSILLDYQSMNLSHRGHPMTAIRPRLRSFLPGSLPKQTVQSLKMLHHGTHTRIAGLTIIMQRPPTAKGTVFATLEDETGLLDLTLWKDVFEKYREAFYEDGLLIISGKVQRDGAAVSLLVQSIRRIHGLGLEAAPTFSESLR